VYVTRHSSVTNPEIREKIWRLYELAFRRLQDEAVSRELLFRDEFDAMLDEPRNRLWVLWHDSEPIAATMIATEIGSTRYLSPEYFQRHYPEHALRGVVHYILWTAVHPAHMAKGALVRLARDTFAVEAEEGSLLIFDTPEVNQPLETGSFAEMTERLSAMVSKGVTVDQVEVHRYFAIDFAKGDRHLSRALEELVERSRA
jgi:hypothetical protein